MTSQVVKCVPAVKRTYMLGVKFLSPLGGNMGRKQIILHEGMVSGIKRFDPMCKLLWCSIPVRPLWQYCLMVPFVPRSFFTVEPRYNEPPYKVLSITNDCLYPSNSKIHEKEPRCNETSL